MSNPKNHNDPWTAADIKLIRELAARGVTTPDIAKRLGRTEAAVRTKASEEGITLMPKDQS